MIHRTCLAALGGMLFALSSCSTTGTLAESGPTSALRVQSTEQTASLTPEQLTESLGTFEEGRWTLRVAGAPTCSVDVYRYEYNTIGARGEPATASGALMVPRGDDARCSQPNPIVVGLHGTMPDRPYDLSDVSGKNPASTRALAWAGVYASQGYIVVAPNYIGLNTSSTDYQSYHDSKQQPQDVIDSIAAARELLPEVSGKASDKLFLVGYSQGGWVTMATHREMEARGMELTASVPMSGVYALSALVDDVFLGRPVRGSTLYFPLAMRAYQEAYGNIYDDPAEVYNPALSPEIATLLPSDTPHYELIGAGRLPASTLFNDRPDLSGRDLSPFVADIMANASPASDPPQFAEIYKTGFGSDFLFNDDFRIAYLQDIEAHPDGALPIYTTGAPSTSAQHPFRQAAIRNDLRNWTPTKPLMMCGGPGDGAAAFRFGGELMMKYWSDPRHAPGPGIVSLLNFEDPLAEAQDFRALRQNFFAEREAIETARQWPVWVDPYHQFLLPRYCYVAAREMFDQMK